MGHPVEDKNKVFPAAMKTVFGYVLFGTNSCRYIMSQEKSCLLVDVKRKSELELNLERFWEIESIGQLDKKEVYASEERQAMRYFGETIEYTSSSAI